MRPEIDPIFIQTFTRLQKLMLCLSHQATISLMDTIAEGHDEEVMEWQDIIAETVKLQQPPTGEEVR